MVLTAGAASHERDAVAGLGAARREQIDELLVSHLSGVDARLRVGLLEGDDSVADIQEAPKRRRRLDRVDDRGAAHQRDPDRARREVDRYTAIGVVDRSRSAA